MGLLTLAIGMGVHLVACSGGGGISEDQLADRLIERDGFTQDEAACVSQATFDAYPQDTVELIYESALLEVSPGDYAPYAYAVARCALQNDLPAPP